MQGNIDNGPWPSSFLIMPPERSTPRVDHIALGKEIQITGKKMAPCTRCANSGKLCIAPRDKKLNRCGRCTQMGRTCDVREMNRMPTVFDWESIDAQIEKLNDQKDEAMAKILRLNKQEKLLRERKQKMIAAGLNSMDELDALEALEAKEKEEREKRETEESMPQQKL